MVSVWNGTWPWLTWRKHWWFYLINYQLWRARIPQHVCMEDNLFLWDRVNGDEEDTSHNWDDNCVLLVPLKLVNIFIKIFKRVDHETVVIFQSRKKRFLIKDKGAIWIIRGKMTLLLQLWHTIGNVWSQKEAKNLGSPLVVSSGILGIEEYPRSIGPRPTQATIRNDGRRGQNWWRVGKLQRPYCA